MVSKKATPTRNVFEVSKSDKVAPMKSTPSPKLPESAFMTSSLGNKTQSNSTTRGIIFGTRHSRQNNMVLSGKNMQSGPSSDKSQPPPDHVSDVRPHHNHDKNGEGESERRGLHRTEENTFISSSHEVETEDDAEEFPRTEVDKHGRGPCKQIKTSRLVRLSKHRIEVPYNEVTRRATSAEIHSLLVHDVGAIIRSHCPMDTGFWGKLSPEKRKDLMDEITTNFKINFEDPDISEYINRLYNGRYREYKAELSKYYKSCKTHANALASPPEEMADRDVNDWEWLCNHFNSDKFKNSSSANTSNRSNKKDNHRTGSRPLSYIVEDMLADGSQFPEVAAFELTYAGKDKRWTNDATKEQHEQMVAKANEYLVEKAKEYNLPEDTPLNEIPVDDPDIGLEIMTSVLGSTPGRLRETKPTSKKVKHLEKELEVERAARKAADAARREAEEKMQNTLRNVGHKFNSTLQSWHQSLMQVGVDIPPFTPFSLEDGGEHEDATIMDD
ncbi:unnamed protein product [Cuscuta europaea]|uniref:Transposase, Ptta/En/Spm, plant n=1 Tax=Cuscuta europaea TaxID=41803 RepID=A0A9P0YUC1_CUSEU|nr:unnamed protein product [Cuscuta europaea]